LYRRELFAGTAALALAARAIDPMADGSASSREEKSVEYYELRKYHLRRGPKVKLIEDYFRESAVPAMRRAGTGPIGVFNVAIGPDSPSLYVLIPHKDINSFATLCSTLATDKDYLTSAREYLNTPATEPTFTRIESSLLSAFESIPKLELPFGGGEAAKRTRIFELRTYESHSEKAGKKKIEMFNNGEIGLFRKAGMSPIFFGETLIGPKMPNLTYMLAYEDMAAHDKQWSSFVNDPEWKKLSTTPGYMDAEIVTSITNVYLRPTAYSQI
jgi:hypothetical protein